MTYNVFSGTLNPTQSVNLAATWQIRLNRLYAEMMQPYVKIL